MNYRVEVTTTAKAEAEAAYLWLAERIPQAVEWFNGLVDAVEGLAVMPTRCGVAHESRHFDEDIRQLLYGKKPHTYRILFVIRGEVVHVLHVRHTSRQTLARRNLKFPEDRRS